MSEHKTQWINTMLCSHPACPLHLTLADVRSCPAAACPLRQIHEGVGRAAALLDETNRRAASVMDEARAREILGASVNGDDGLGPSIDHLVKWFKGNVTAWIVGDFTPEQLRAVAWWMENKGANHGR